MLPSGAAVAKSSILFGRPKYRTRVMKQSAGWKRLVEVPGAVMGELIEKL